MARFTFADGSDLLATENPLPAISKVVDAAIELLALDRELSDRRTRAHFSQAVADEELSRLGALKRWIDEAIEPMLCPEHLAPRSVSEEAALRIQKSAQRTLAKSVAAVSKNQKRATDIAKNEEIFTKLTQVVRALILDCNIPNLQWALRYKTPPRGVATLHISAQGAEKTQLTCRATPDSILYNAPLQVGSIQNNLIIPIPGRRTNMRPVNVDSYIITHLELGTDSDRFRIQKSKRRLSDGFQVLIRNNHPIIIPVDAKDKHIGDEFLLTGEAHDRVLAFWKALMKKSKELIALRTEVNSFKIGRASMLDTRDPLVAAKALLSTIEPIVKEIRGKHSKGLLAILSEDASATKVLSISDKQIKAKLDSVPEGYHKFFREAGVIPTGPLPGLTKEKVPPANDARKPLPASSDRLPTERISTTPYIGTPSIEVDLDDSAA